MNRRIHDLALFILSKIKGEDKANEVLSLLAHYLEMKR